METVIRVTVIYIVILIGLRVLGKREFSQLSPLELVTLLLVPEIVSQSMIGEDFSVTNGIIGLTTLFTIVFLISLVKHKSHRFEIAVDGRPSLLVAHGELIEDNLNRERLTPDEIFGEMHHAGLDDLSQVRWAILETDGTISIVPEDAPTGRKRGKPADKSSL